MSELHRSRLTEIAAGTASAVDVVRACMTAVVRGESGPARLNAFVSYDYEAAVAQAERIDEDVRGGRSYPLRGVPLAIKDNICTLGLPTTCASRILAGYRSPFEATAVRRLRAAGAIIVGKTNLDEFAMGTSTETSAFGATRNPHDFDRVPGGSSGGSAAAVAAGMVPAALGSDTGGSVRQPAAFCGVVGIRPTYGRVSRYGLVAFASSLDQIGVLARTVNDAALLLDVIAGPDGRDATARAVTQFAPESAPTIALPREYFERDLADPVRRACVEAVAALRDAGCTMRSVSLPHTPLAIPTYCAIAAAEASSNLARFDGVRFGVRASGSGSFDEICTRTRGIGFGAEVKRRITLGAHLLAAESGGLMPCAFRARALVTHDFERVFADGIDLLFTPTTPAPAFRVGAHRDAYDIYSSDALTAPASLAGLPAISVPIGRAGPLPVGGQLIAPRWRDARMIATARLLERLLEA